MIRFRHAILAVSALAIAAVGCASPGGEAPAPVAKTPIRHLIVVVGENLSFDNLYGTYEPVRP
jgi:phospholipase C